MFCALNTVVVPITITCILLGMVAVGGIALFAQRRKHLRGVMPHGAEAALWSITEVLPDPRNHLAIKDPTSELRLTADERRLAAEAAADARRRAEVSVDRPATKAAAERSASARQAALVKRDELTREKQRRALADRDPAAFSSPDVVDQLEAISAEAISAEAISAEALAAETLAIDLREDTGELQAVHTRAS